MKSILPILSLGFYFVAIAGAILLEPHPEGAREVAGAWVVALGTLALVSMIIVPLMIRK